MTWSLTADLDGDSSGVFETDWTAYLQRAVINRGREHSLAAIEPGKATFTLDNGDGRFSPYKGTITGLDHFKRVRLADTTSLFTGFISDFSFEPGLDEQLAFLEAVDILGLAAGIKINMGVIDGRTSDLSLQRVLDLCERGEVVTNPTVSVDLTGWAAVGTCTMTRSLVSPFEGIACVKAVTGNVAAGEGVEFDVTAGTAPNSAWLPSVFVIGSASLRLVLWDDVYGQYNLTDQNITGTAAWQYARKDPGGMAFLNNGSTKRTLRVVTTTQQASTFYVCPLHMVPYANRIGRTCQVGQTSLYRVSFTDENGLEAIRKIVDSEPGFLWVDGTGTVQFKARTYAPALEMTFSDDITDANKRYQSLRPNFSSGDRISKVVVNCAALEDVSTETTVIWRLETNGNPTLGPLANTSGNSTGIGSAWTRNGYAYLIDTSKSWATNEWVGALVEVVEGGHSHWLNVSNNSGDTLHGARWYPHEPTSDVLAYTVTLNGYRRYTAKFAAPCQAPTIVVAPVQASCTAVWESSTPNGGVILLTNAGAVNWTITDLHVEGLPVTVISGGGEAVYEYEPPNAVQFVDRELSLDMPFDLETADIVRDTAIAEGNKRADMVFRTALTIDSDSDAYWALLRALDIRDQVRLINTWQAHSLGVDTNCWIEGIGLDLEELGKKRTVTLKVEEV